MCATGTAPPVVFPCRLTTGHLFRCPTHRNDCPRPPTHLRTKSGHLQLDLFAFLCQAVSPQDPKYIFWTLYGISQTTNDFFERGLIPDYSLFLFCPPLFLFEPLKHDVYSLTQYPSNSGRPEGGYTSVIPPFLVFFFVLVMSWRTRNFF